MGRIRRKRTRDISSPVTDGFVSSSEYAQPAVQLSRARSDRSALGSEHRTKEGRSGVVLRLEPAGTDPVQESVRGQNGLEI